MIIENQAIDLEDGTTKCAHKIEIACPACGNDITEDEVAAGTCSECGASFSEPKQSIEIHATSIPLIGITF